MSLVALARVLQSVALFYVLFHAVASANVGLLVLAAAQNPTASRLSLVASLKPTQRETMINELMRVGAVILTGTVVDVLACVSLFHARHRRIWLFTSMGATLMQLARTAYLLLAYVEMASAPGWTVQWTEAAIALFVLEALQLIGTVTMGIAAEDRSAASPLGGAEKAASYKKSGGALSSSVGVSSVNF
ncbi:hypothetical protein H9P43_009519 [Blastocladiella emersonii ATCC 22665]|nr:hypothetical protein H9P43_009519 [Blastocladiella emersonii ATCC 22665]